MWPNDYIYCKDCEIFVDVSNYVTVDDAGQGYCRWQCVAQDEFARQLLVTTEVPRFDQPDSRPAPYPRVVETNA